MTTSDWNQRSENDREKPFDPFEEEGDSPFAEDAARQGAQDFGGNPGFDNGQGGFDNTQPGFDNDQGYSQDQASGDGQGFTPEQGQGYAPDQDQGDTPDQGQGYGDASAQPGFDGAGTQPADDLADETFEDDGADRFESPAQLDLGDDEQRLPWLEGDPDEDDDRGAGAGQIVLLGLAAIALLAIVVGGIWWATRAGPDADLVADGGTISAPEGPYKERPEDPGGRVASGTGDTAFAVAEGETRPMRVGQGEPAPEPGFDSVQPKASAPAPAETPAPSASPASTPAASGPGVQVGAYSNRESAEQGWQKLSSQYEGLSGMRYRIVEGQADIGKVYRLQALPGDSAAAQNLCRGLKAARIPCQVKN